SSFATLALVLAVVGVYGVLAQSVAQRTREIGVRVALGANRAQIASLIARQAAIVVSAGLLAGLGGALALSQITKSLLIKVSPTGPMTLAGAVVMLPLAAGAACVIPVRRALRVDPLVALRTE